MKKTKSLIFYIIAFLVMFLYIFSGINFSSVKTHTFAQDSQTYIQSAQTNDNFYLNAYDRNGNMLTAENETTFDGGKKAYIFNWEDIEKFQINIDAAKKIPPKNYQSGEEVYNLIIQVEFLQGYYNKASWTNLKTLQLYSETQSGENSFENFINTKPHFNIDNGIKGEDVVTKLQASISGWGIYKFKMIINNYQETYSDYFIVQPTQELFITPKISYKTSPSQITLHSAYTFSLKNPDDFKYVDPSKITWYALGKAQNGNTYSLTFNDINSGKKDFENCTSGLYDVYTRTGKTFYFDDNGVTGTWKIWCEYSYDGSSANILKSNVQTIKTGQPFTSSTLIWIILGVCVLCAGITILICVIKIKKEKIYPVNMSNLD